MNEYVLILPMIIIVSKRMENKLPLSTWLRQAISRSDGTKAPAPKTTQKFLSHRNQFQFQLNFTPDPVLYFPNNQETRKKENERKLEKH